MISRVRRIRRRSVRDLTLGGTMGGGANLSRYVGMMVGCWQWEAAFWCIRKDKLRVGSVSVLVAW